MYSSTLQEAVDEQFLHRRSVSIFEDIGEFGENVGKMPQSIKSGKNAEKTSGLTESLSFAI